MPTWGELLQELGALQRQGKSPHEFDMVRRKYLKLLSEHTGRNTILYASNWTQPQNIPPGLLSITHADVHALMEVVHGLKGTSLDIILHSPGGSAEATEAIVSYLRKKFTGIRVIVPQAAMSAATMLACAANRIVMGKHSSLGPIDPQMILETPLGQRAVPAQAILDQFAKAQEECKDPAKLASWLPMLNQYGPALLKECENANKLSEELVSRWLKDYMFLGMPNADARAKKIAAALGSHVSFKSHGRSIDRDQARNLGGADGLVVDDLEADQKLQDLALSVFHATAHTFNARPVAKIVENQLGRAFVATAGVVIQEPPQVPKGSQGNDKQDPLAPKAEAPVPAP